ncbi:MAG TPA: DinB family protein [Blastocatellia bacterium]|nr:DinB family protein [Blastocatellia bacterium]
MSLSASLLPEFDQETAGTRKTLERLPEDKLDWRPHEKSMAMAELATHIANMLGWGTITLTQDSFDMQPPGAAPYHEEPVKSRAELLEKFDANVAAFRSALAAASDEAMMADWSLLRGGNVLFTLPRIGCIRGMILNHIIHHRAQLCVYYRLNDIPVPPLYGPSADEGAMGM